MSGRWFLPVSSKEREGWSHKPPRYVSRAENDYVSYHAVRDGPKARLHRIGMEPNQKHVACYASCRPNFDRYEITCYPNRRKQCLTLSQVREFFSILEAYQIVPRGLVFWEESGKGRKGIFCKLKPGLGNPHLYYTALTCYRWVDRQPSLVWEFLQIMADGTPRHPLQVLPHLVVKWAGDYNHSFIVNCIGPRGRDSFQGPYNPVLGVAGKIYFDREDPRGSKDFDNPAAYVNESIDRIAFGLSPTTAHPCPKPWDPKFTIHTPKYTLLETVDALHPALYELYTIPKITSKQVEEILSGLFTVEGE